MKLFDNFRELTSAINFNPKVAEYYVVRGKARYLLANFKGAYKDYKKCLELNPACEEVKELLKQFEANGVGPNEEESSNQTVNKSKDPFQQHKSERGKVRNFYLFNC